MTVYRDAVLSDDGQYRYWLERTWNASRPPLVWIMLNPSTADAKVDDATIRVCMGRAHKLVAGGIIVVNLFAYRATRPADLYHQVDPIGPENNAYLLRAMEIDSVRIVVAWGAHGVYRGRDRAVWELFNTLRRDPLYCLGTTKGGSPKHPLRISYDTPLVPWAFPL